MDPISVVIPVYNSEASLAHVVREVAIVLSSITKKFEIILVNDGSRDQSWQVIERLVAKEPSVRGIQLMRNFGQHNALLAGIRAARFPITITLDDDGQNPPSEISKLLEKFSEGFDVVYGYPEHQQHGFWRVLASAITRIVLKNTMGAETARHISAFRVIRTKIRKSFEDFRGAYVSLDVLLTWGGKRFATIPVKHLMRTSGTSNYTIWKLISHAVNMLTGFSAVPLQIASITGFATMAFGVLILFYTLIRYFLQGSPVQGFPFLASIISIFSGTQLFSLGVVGEYLARMHFRMMDRPCYVIDDTVEAPQNSMLNQPKLATV